MKLVKVIKNGQVVQPAKFDNDTDMNAWIQMLADTGAWGLQERPELNEMGEPTGVVLPAEYEIIVEDISQQIEQEKINQEALDYLASTDWYVTRFIETNAAIPEGVLSKRAEARSRIVK